MNLDEAVREAWKMAHGAKVIGLGSGRTIVPFIEAAADNPGTAQGAVFVPTSLQAKGLLDRLHLRASDLNSHPDVDITVDGCDAFDAGGNMIKGGGGCMLQEKIVAEASAAYVVLAAAAKRTDRLLQRPFPIEVHPLATNSVIRQLARHGIANVAVREGSGKLGPVITDSGNVLLDVTVDQAGADIYALQATLSQIAGVLETGLYLDFDPKILCFNG